jgi:hypothetical protein
MTTPSKSPTTSEHARLQNDFGADYWVRPAQEHRVRTSLIPHLITSNMYSILTYIQRATAGRGLFAGLQDTKHYNVESGWARRKSTDSQTGFLVSIWGR